MYYTALFGSLPLAVRLIVSYSVGGQDIPPFALSDVVFLSIMFNVAGMVNVTNTKDALPDVAAMINIWACTNISLLAALYTVGLFPAVNSCIAGMFCGLFLISSLALSWCSLDSEFLLQAQTSFDNANFIENEVPVYQRDAVRRCADHQAEVENRAISTDSGSQQSAS